jgi:hypothetical protein
MNPILRAFIRLVLCTTLGVAGLAVVDPQPVAACANCITCSPYPGPSAEVCMPCQTGCAPEYAWTWCQWDCVTDDGGASYHPANIHCIPVNNEICANKPHCTC